MVIHNQQKTYLYTIIHNNKFPNYKGAFPTIIQISTNINVKWFFLIKKKKGEVIPFPSPENSQNIILRSRVW